LVAAKHAVEAFLQLAEGLIEVRRPFLIAATASTTTATTPGILVIRVATRLIPSHSALHSKKAKDAPCARPPMLPKARCERPTAASGIDRKSTRLNSN